MQPAQPSRIRFPSRSWLLVATLLLAATSGQAAYLPMPTQGICAFSLPLHYPFAYLEGPTPGTNIGLNWIGTINFATGSISANVLLQNPAGASSTTETQGSFTAAYTVTSGPIPGSYTLSFTPASNEWQFNVIPVLGGRRLMIQAWSPVAGNQAASAAGICRFEN